MNFRNTLSLHKPPHSYGDCVRACVATLIDRDDVPHTFDNRNVEQSWADLRAYLESNGLNICINVFEDDPKEYMEVNNHNVYYILFGSNESKTHHCVIYRNSTCIHDPAYYKTPIVGPLDNGLYITAVIVKQP